jgi:sigma-B regulation protein RsbU (phosphoserine phosphatase)
MLSSLLAASPFRSSRALTRWEGAGFDVSGLSRGEDGTTGGGDFYTLAVRGPGRIGVIIGDACGRGVDGAAQLARILPRVHQLALSEASPAELLRGLNRTVAAELSADRFVTAAAFELDLVAGTLTVANAGHVPAIVRRAKEGTVSVVGRPSGIPLGIVESTTYIEEHCELARGDVVVLMTDGLLEAVEADLLSMSTLLRLLEGASESAASVHRVLLERCDECNIGKRADDLTLVALEATHGLASSRFSDLSRRN